MLTYDVYFVETAVNAVRQGNIDQTVFARNWHCRFSAHFGQRIQSRTLSAAKDQCDNIFFHVSNPYRYFLTSVVTTVKPKHNFD